MAYLHWVLLERKRKRLNWESLERKRKRSGSRSGSSSPPHRRSRLEYGNPSVVSYARKAPSKSIRFIYRTEVSESDGVRTHILTIPSKELRFFRHIKDNLRTRHIHHPSRCDPLKFHDITTTITPVDLGVSTLCPSSTHSLIGDNLYSLFGETKLELWSHSLNPNVPPRLLSSPLASQRYFPTSFALRAKFYIWSKLSSDPDHTPQNFGEVYDPDTDAWSGIHAPPSSDPLIGQKHVFIASLGEVEGKVLFFDYAPGFNSLVYLYDVTSGEWTIHDKTPPLEFEPTCVYQRTVINEYDGLLYWVDARRGSMCALDWRSMTLYQGPIVGAEHMAILRCLQYLPSGVSLHHLWGQYFCLVLSHKLDVQIHDPSITENHYTFLRVVRNSQNGLLAFVLGCFMESRPLSPTISDIICA